MLKCVEGKLGIDKNQMRVLRDKEADAIANMETINQQRNPTHNFTVALIIRTIIIIIR